jgi:hypothetical protein
MILRFYFSKINKTENNNDNDYFTATIIVGLIRHYGIVAAEMKLIKASEFLARSVEGACIWITTTILTYKIQP